MFASLDAGRTRHLHAFQIRPGLYREIRPPESLQNAAQRMLTLPSSKRMREVALALSRVESADHGKLDRVLIQVWQTRYDPQTLAPTSQILREFSLVMDHD